MPAPNTPVGETYLDSFLTTYSESYVQDIGRYCAPVASTPIPVLFQSGSFVTYPKGYFLRDDFEIRPLGARPVRSEIKVERKPYSCEEWGLEETIDDRQSRNQQAPVNIELAKTRALTQKGLIRSDRVWSTGFFKPGVWTFDLAGVTSAPDESNGQFLRFDEDGSDPIGFIEGIKDQIDQATGFMPNTLILGTKVKQILRTHDDITERIKHVGTGVAEETKLAELFNVDRVRTSRAVFNSSQEGEDDNIQRIVPSNSMWLGYIEPEPSLDAPTAIATFLWTGLVPGAEPNGLGVTIERYRDGPAHSDILQGRMAWGMGQVADDLGAYFKDVVTADS